MRSAKRSPRLIAHCHPNAAECRWPGLRAAIVAKSTYGGIVDTLMTRVAGFSRPCRVSCWRCSSIRPGSRHCDRRAGLDIRDLTVEPRIGSRSLKLVEDVSLTGPPPGLTLSFTACARCSPRLPRSTADRWRIRPRQSDHRRDAYERDAGRPMPDAVLLSYGIYDADLGNETYVRYRNGPERPGTLTPPMPRTKS
jgi:hypothetical protein